MPKIRPDKLSRREREIMDVIFRNGTATVADVVDGLSDPPSYSAVRATLNVLVAKDFLQHRKDGRRFMYSPKLSRSRAGRVALQHLLKTFFDDSPEGAVAALLELRSSDLDPETLARIQKMIEEAQKEGR